MENFLGGNDGIWQSHLLLALSDSTAPPGHPITHSTSPRDVWDHRAGQGMVGTCWAWEGARALQQSLGNARGDRSRAGQLMSGGVALQEGCEPTFL